MMKQVLAIETSCDDTAVALVREPRDVVISLSADQIEDHLPFGGVVPEIAGRKHSLVLLSLIDECFKKTGQTWDDIDGICVTSRPGLVSSLFVGVMTAKTLSLCQKKPCRGVNHLESHLYAPFLRDPTHSGLDIWQEPFLALAVSGGHTHLYKVHKLGKYELLGKTLDDAAGEAFDKFAKMIGLGFPGGVLVDKKAETGDPHKYKLPRPLIKEKNLNFSFSGLKTASQNLFQKMPESEKKDNLNDLCASFQQAVVDCLLTKLRRAQEQFQIPRIVITGGVSANSLLRKLSRKWAQENNFEIALPPLRYCTDNAAMVGLVGLKKFQLLGAEELEDIQASSRIQKGDFLNELPRH